MNNSVRIISLLSGIFIIIGIVFAHIPEEMFSSRASIFAITLLSLPAFIGLYSWYKNKALVLIILLGIFALTIETIGIHTGFPYSFFQYENPLGYLLFDTTPWTVAIAWSPLVIGAYVLAHRACDSFTKRFLCYITLLVGIDLVLDPGSVARGLWSYQSSGPYGVPLVNYLGWIFSGTLVYMLICSIVGSIKKPTRNLVPVSSSYVLSIGLWTGVNIGYEQYLPAGIGIVLLLISLHVIKTNQKGE